MTLKQHLKFLLICLPIFCKAQPDISIEPIYTDFNQPLGLTHADDDRIFIVEKEGKIICINTRTDERYTFLDIKNIVSTNANERGLLGLAMDPDFKSNGNFFVNYTNNQGNTVIARFTVYNDNPKIANPDSRLEIMNINQPYSNHNGGCIAFGKDGYLYIGNGDGGSAGDPQNFSQNPESLLGKMLRIDVSESTSSTPYNIPGDNPYLNDAAVEDEIWAFGLRNPWRFSFDKLNGDLWIGDVGQNVWEEVDYVPYNAFNTAPNFGWRCYEGFEAYNTSNCNTSNDYDDPLIVYNNDDDGCSITGGYVYRGCAYPDLYGYYLYIDYCSGRIWGINADGDNLSNAELMENFSNFNFASFGEDSQGELYLIGIANGIIYKIKEDNNEISYALEKTDISCDGSELGEISFISSSAETYWTNIEWNLMQSDQLSIEQLNEGNYTLSLEGTNGCQLSFSENIESPTILGSVLQLNTNANEDSLQVNENFDNYQWLINGIDQQINVSKIRISASGLYEINVWNNDRPECILTESQDIISSTKEKDLSSAMIWPNPVKEQIFISGLNALIGQKVIVKIYDINGKICFNEYIEVTETIQLNFNNLESGVYLLKMETNALEEVFVQKFIK
jgi:glucose/arabinose dehydrogenase